MWDMKKHPLKILLVKNFTFFFNFSQKKWKKNGKLMSFTHANKSYWVELKTELKE